MKYHHDSKGARRQFDAALEAVRSKMPDVDPDLVEQTAIAVLVSVNLPQVCIGLEDAVKLIEGWHGMGMCEADARAAWKLYSENAPEMQSINLALQVIRGEK